MEITWHGNTCFKFKGKNTNLVINPDSSIKDLKAEILLSSIGEDTASTMEKAKFDWPGEYEINDVPILAIPAKTEKGTENEPKGESTILFYFEMDGINVCHLGDLGHPLTKEMVKQLEAVDVLLISIGDKSKLSDKDATEVIEAIDPRVLIPMNCEKPSEYLKNLDASEVKENDKFTIKSAKDLPIDNRETVLLKKV